MNVFKFFRLVFIAVGIFVVLVFSVITLWLAPSKIKYELRKNVLNSLPQYPKALTWSRQNKPANFLNSEIHTIYLTYPKDTSSEVFNYYKDYLLTHGWTERISPTFGQSSNTQFKTNSMTGLSEFEKKIFGIFNVTADLRSDEFYDHGKPIKTNFTLQIDEDYTTSPTEYFKKVGLTEIDMAR